MTAAQSLPLDALKTAATELAEIARDLGLDQLAESIDADQRRRLGDQRLRVMVLGEIKHGKSSLINALCGENLLPVGVTPTTGRVVAVRSGPVSGRFLIPSNGASESVDEERFGKLVRGKEDAGTAALEVQVGGGSLPDTIELVDTPGLNDLDRFRGAASRGELPRADVLLLVLDATQALTRTELELLRDAITAVGGLGRSGARLEVAVNRIDLVSESDRDVVVGHIREQLSEVLALDLDATDSGFVPFTTDAKGALKDPDDDSHGVREVARLRDRLRELANHRDDILPARMRSSLLTRAKTLRYNALIQARAVTLDAERLERERAAIQSALEAHAYDLGTLRNTLQTGRAEIVEASVRRSEEFRRALQSDALGQVDGADLRSLTDVLPGAIQTAFIEFSRNEAILVKEALERLTDEAIRTHGEQARQRLLEASLRLGFAGPSIYVEPPSLVIEVGMIALGIAGTAIMYFGNMVTGMVMTIASPLATMLLRERSVRDARVQARSLIPTALARAESGLADTIRRAVEDYVTKLDEHLVGAAEGLGEQLLATLRRAEARLEEMATTIDAQGTSEAESEAPAAEETAKASTVSADEGASHDEPSADGDSKADDTKADDTKAKATRPSEGEPVEIPDPVREGGIKVDPAERARTDRLRKIAAGARAQIADVESRLGALVGTLTELDLQRGSQAT